MSRRRKSGYFRPYSLQNGIPRIDLLHIKSAADLLVCSAIDPPLRCARRDCTMTRFVTRFTIIFLGLSVSALAQGQPDNWYGAASIVYNDDDPDRVLDDSLSGFQISVGRDINDYVSLEGLLGYSDISAFCELGNCYPDQRHSSRRCQSALFRANRETSRPSTMPTSPIATLLTSSVKPSRPAACEPD